MLARNIDNCDNSWQEVIIQIEVDSISKENGMFGKFELDAALKGHEIEFITGLGGVVAFLIMCLIGLVITRYRNKNPI